MDKLAFTHASFISPFTWRYGTPDMQRVWSEIHKRQLLRKVWVALADAQHQAGLVTADQVADLRAHQDAIDIERSAEIEAIIHHDLMAEVKTYAEQCPVGGGIIHLGATSMDISDNVAVLRIREAMDLVLENLRQLLSILADQIIDHADLVCMAFTHIQPAEPTTVGYRLAQYAQDLLMDLEEVQRVRDNLRGKGIKGAVGTSASYKALLDNSVLSPAEMESLVMQALELKAFPVTTQTYPRKQDWLVLNALTGIAGSLYKFAFDLRLLQSPPLGEWSEPFGEKQVGSSAMPFKRNPIKAENIDSLARFIATLPRVAWDNAAHSLLERTLDDSGNRREVLPVAFLAVDELLQNAKSILGDLRLYTGAIDHNLETYGVFAATERVLMALVRRGADRQTMHEIIREHAMTAWAVVHQDSTQANPLPSLLCQDTRISRFLQTDVLLELLDARTHIGDAPQRARALAERVRSYLAQ
ncbi:MAG: adenylosuccinate lyase [Anaerolineae bacterium]|nr:adenylosuccinate lyase [Anaerolineae bacterium]